jgi:hypothetical protein
MYVVVLLLTSPMPSVLNLIVHLSCGIPVPRDLAAANRKESLAHVDLYDSLESNRDESTRTNHKIEMQIRSSCLLKIMTVDDVSCSSELEETGSNQNRRVVE